MTTTKAGTKGVPRLDREHQILRAASVEFGTQGYAATSIASIAAKAGISKPLIYNYFGSKEGLFIACLEWAGSILADEIERIARGDSIGIERGILTLAGIFATLEPHPHIWKLFFDPSAPTTGAVGGAIAHYTQRISKLADEGVSELMALAGSPPHPGGAHGDVLDISAMTAVWLSIVDSLVTWWLDHPSESADDMTQRCGRLIAALFGGTT